MLWIDLKEVLPEEWFDEVSTKPKTELSIAAHAPYESQCKELLGNMQMTLYFGADGCYYLEVGDCEPIGDYGSHWFYRWYKSNDDERVSIELLNQMQVS